MDYIFILLLLFTALVFLAIGYKLAQLNVQKRLALTERKLEERKEKEERLLLELKNSTFQIQEKTRQLEESKTKFQNVQITLGEERSKNDYLNRTLEFQKNEQKKVQKESLFQFEKLANQILEEKSEKFTTQNKENITALLSPLQLRIREFQTKVEDSHRENLTRGAALKQQLEELSRNNLAISQEAQNLTQALKGDKKIQGNWGELVLRRVLEKSGLEKDREYFEQESKRNEAGELQKPDVIIRLPDNKIIVIDSKVSLVAYEAYVSSEDEKQKTDAKSAIAKAILAHVGLLSRKNYHALYDGQSPDFVLLFVPIEPVFALALQTEPNLYNLAFDKNIIIVTPTTLLATLRTVDSMWTGQKQQENALEIAKRAGNLHDKFVGLLDDVTRLGNQLNTVQNTYSSLQIKLKGQGNLISKIDKLKRLGARTNKSIPDNWKSLDKEEE